MIGPTSGRARAVVEAVEGLWEGVVSSPQDPTRLRLDRPKVPWAMWLCACETLGPAPTWVLYELPDVGPGWFVLPGDLRLTDVLDAERVWGAHVDPESVLVWLRGEVDARGAVPRSDSAAELVRRAATRFGVVDGSQSGGS